MIDPALAATPLCVIYVINPFDLALRQLVSHCLTIGELILARGMLLKAIKKEAKEQILVS